jgi:hypothetical protein
MPEREFTPVRFASEKRNKSEYLTVRDAGPSHSIS